MSRRLLVAIGILVLFLVLVVLAVVLRSSATPEPDPVPSPTSSAPVTPTQNTMLVAVRDDNSLITDSVVLGSVARANSTPTGSWLSVQPGLAIAVNSSGSVSLSQRGPFSPADVSREVTNELGFTVDGAFILDRLAFAALVDSVGGVTVNSPVPIVVVDADGKTTVVVKAGKRKIFGPAAAQYVIALNPNEEQAGRMARFDDVWSQVLLKLPGNLDKVRSIVGSLGSLSRISLTPEQVSQGLLDAQTSLTAKTMTMGTPSAQVAGTGSTAIYTVIPVGTQPTVERLFGISVLVPGTNGAVPRVRVFAAGATYDSLDDAQTAFTTNGLSLVWGGQLEPLAKSQIFIPNESARATGDQVAKTLGLPTTMVTIDPAETVGVQVAVRLAADSTFTTPSPTTSVTAK